MAKGTIRWASVGNSEDFGLGWNGTPPKRFIIQLAFLKIHCGPYVVKWRKGWVETA